MNRLPESPTQKIDRAQTITFTWQGKPMSGVAGDSVASALFANGVRVFGRSLKYHRPRGLYSLDGESANTLVHINDECNVCAETTPLAEKMQIRPQNVSGDVESDRWSFLDKLDGFMPAGFYYRRFHRPYSIWKPASAMIRKMAGTGVVDPNSDKLCDQYGALYPNAEVCVIGGGPAGMTAALAAAQTGVRVVLFEARPWLGGFYSWRVKEENGQPLNARAENLASKVMAAKNIRVFTNCCVIDVCGDNLISAFQVGGPDDDFIQRYINIRPSSVVVATGCIERPLVFENNERPGVMQVNCAHRLAHTYGLLPGRKAVFSVGDDLGLEAALDLANLGLDILAVADARMDGHNIRLVNALRGKGISFLPGWAASRVEGKLVVNAVVLAVINNGAGNKRVACDLVVASAGQSAVNGPLSTVGAKFAFDEYTALFQPTELPPRVYPAGRMLGYTNTLALEISGELAGLKAAQDAGMTTKVETFQATLETIGDKSKGCNLVHGPNIGLGRKSFVCFDEDGTYKTAKQSAEQGMDMPELAKRFGGFGLGPGQNGVPGQNLPMIMGKLRGSGSSEFVPTTQRSPLKPILMSTLAGGNHDIYKRTPMHAEQEKEKAIFRRIGVWKRARYFSQDFTSVAEIQNVRTNVGIIDVSTLGKFRVFGPDAQKVLQRVYISDMSKVSTGKTKYSAMLNDDGMLLDDGVVTKVGENDYYFTTSTGRAGGTIEWMRYHARHEKWDFNLVNLTDHLAAVNLAGPNSRKVLSKLVDEDISNEAFPYMGYRGLKLKGFLPVRAMRVGFVGELGFELHFPSSYGSTVWNWVMEAGQEFGIKPFGLEAQSCLRLEKGHVIIGQESEQRVNLLDLNMGFAWDRDDYFSQKVGAPALRFTENQKGRMKLIGFEMDANQDRPLDGSVVYDGDRIEGFVCTCRKSVTLNKIIGMALVTDYLTELGGTINIYQNDSNKPVRFTAKVVKPHFYDLKGERQKV